jgi:hypothetical protein
MLTLYEFNRTMLRSVAASLATKTKTAFTPKEARVLHQLARAVEMNARKLLPKARKPTG